jgi:hypothetical protein
VIRVAGRTSASVSPGVLTAQVALSVGGALVAEYALTTFTSFASGPDGLYGGPLPVGRSRATVLFGDPNATFSLAAYAANVALTSVVLFALARWAGTLAACFAVAAIPASFVALFLMSGAGLPFAGLPIPAYRDQPLPPFVFLWVDMVAWAVGAAALVRWLRVRSRPRAGEASAAR